MFILKYALLPENVNYIFLFKGNKLIVIANLLYKTH